MSPLPPTQSCIAPRSPEAKDKGLLPPLEWEPAGLGAPGGIQGMRMGLQGPHTSASGKGLAEQRRSSSMPVQCLSCPLAAVQRQEFSRWEAREKQRPEEGKHPDKQTKRTEETSKLPGPEPESTSLGGPRPRPCSGMKASPVPGPQEGTIRPLLPAAGGRRLQENPRLSPSPAVLKAAGTLGWAKAR